MLKQCVSCLKCINTFLHIQTFLTSKLAYLTTKCVLIIQNVITNNFTALCFIVKESNC